VRKVLGATVPEIVVLLSKEFTGPVVIAFVVAVPVVYVAMRRWLDGFAYHVDIAWWIFLLAGLTAFVVAWLTVSYQAVKAAAADPITSLRYE
jgi:putative ABC transport system permease protein